MGNHTIDCPFCGQDQRLTSSCCQAYRDHEAELLREAALRSQADRDLLKLYGLEGDDWEPYRVPRALRKLQARGLLKTPADLEDKTAVELYATRDR